MSYLSYSGDKSPQEVWALLQAHADCRVIDVRTQAEWAYVGFPNLKELPHDLVLAEWQLYPSMQVNPHFTVQVEQALLASGATKATQLFFLCRSGVRSKSAAAALTEVGYTACFNVLDGFEGAPDPSGHRGKVSGWKKDGLPWRQG